MKKIMIMMAFCLLLTCAVDAQTVDMSSGKNAYSALKQPQQSNQSEDETKAKLQEINKELLDLEQQIKSLQSQKLKLEEERQQVFNKYAANQREASFQSSPASIFESIASDSSIVIRSFDGYKKEIVLTGIFVPMSKSEDAKKWLKDKLAAGDGLVYLRCQNPECSKAQIYTDKNQSSLNDQMIKSSLAFPLGTNGPILPGQEAATQPATPTNPTYYPEPSSRPTPGTEVQVKGYYRKDGTYVQPHTRSAPRRKP